jgi:predicted ATPase
VLGGERPSRERLFARVSAALGDIAPRDRLLVVVLDDVQWLDEASAELLHWTARTNRDQRVVLALATREGEIADNAPLVRVLRGLRREGLLEELALRSLEPEDTAALAAALAAALGVRSDAADLHARSGGNPLFAREIALAAASSPGADALPASVAGLVRDRIAQLPDRAAEVVRWGAVLGGSWREERLAPVSALGAAEVVSALELLERRALLARDGDTYRFAHDLVRQVVYADISEPRRRLMHRRVAQWLVQSAGASVGGSADEIVADVARHATLAGDAAEACLGAARRSLRVFANADAYALARRGARHAWYSRRQCGPRRIARVRSSASRSASVMPCAVTGSLK